ncbi:MAG: RNA-binding transcriptional accessory protein, partial [Deltaproteobacteria bacterium]|nr:RNA-binding transcriptional accessory protein [Deltaproteobacteria bacterium]
MNSDHISRISGELACQAAQVESVAQLLEQGATIPFIARYRKETTGSLDEVVITSIRDRLARMADLDARCQAILKSLGQHGHLTDELKKQVMAAETMAILEDIYLPFKPKRRTKATIAREKGLEPLASIILNQEETDPLETALTFIDPEKQVETVDDALSGARDIIAETINEDPKARAAMRQLFEKKAMCQSIVATGKESDGAKYKDYFNWQEPAIRAPSHRILAMRRGEKEDILNLSIAPPVPDALALLEDLFVKNNNDNGAQVRLAITDCYKRLLSRSMETEMRLSTKQKADTEAIRIFAENLRQLLLEPPLGSKRVMGIDPGFRTGCKVVCLDRQGKLLHYRTIYPHMSEKKDLEAAEQIMLLAARFDIEAIAIGNGTAGRETETLVRSLNLPEPVQIISVNESGASVYSASETARAEFPDLDLTIRGAVSIGRRLMDPLSELVKLDPKSIGVGQYQHDVDQSDLKQALDDVVISCVNRIGVDLNRASVELLTYVSGLGPGLAGNIVAFRDENGPFSDREGLKKVPRLGPKAFEQSAGFLRIPAGANPLDASAMHPESYPVVYDMARDLNCDATALMADADLRNKIDITSYVTGKIGIPTLTDIMTELAKPGRDPRRQFEAFIFESGIEKISDLRAGMQLPGIITNITAFGAFVDIGVHQDGLVHISKMANRFVKDPSKVVKMHQKVNV